jgi:hypothetical protein
MRRVDTVDAYHAENIPDEIWETLIILPNIISPLLRPPPTKVCYDHERDNYVPVAGTYNGQRLTLKTVENVVKTCLDGTSIIPSTFATKPCIPQGGLRAKWADDGSEVIGHLCDVQALGRRNRHVVYLMLVCKKWLAAFGNYAFRLSAVIDNVAETAVQLANSDYMGEPNSAPLPTVLKSNAARVQLVATRRQALAPPIDPFHPPFDEVIPAGALLGDFDTMHIAAVGGGVEFPATFAKRIHSVHTGCASIIHATGNRCSARIETAATNANDLVPVMNADSRPTVVPWTFRCKLETTSIAAARKAYYGVNKKPNPPLPLAVQIRLESRTDTGKRLTLRTPCVFVVSEKAASNARERLAQKRRQRTERDRRARKKASIYTTEDHVGVACVQL